MADEAQPDSGGGAGWRVRPARLVTDGGWDAQPPPLPPSVAALAPEPVQVLEQPARSAGPASTAAGRARRHLHRRRRHGSGSGRPAAAPASCPHRHRHGGRAHRGVAGTGIYVVTHPSPAVGVPLSTPPPTTVAVVHSGPAVLALESLTGSGNDPNAAGPRSSGGGARDARSIQGVPARHRPRRCRPGRPGDRPCGRADRGRQAAGRRGAVRRRLDALRHRQPRRDRHPDQHVDRTASSRRDRSPRG